VATGGVCAGSLETECNRTTARTAARSLCFILLQAFLSPRFALGIVRPQQAGNESIRSQKYIDMPVQASGINDA
jgi:hypothetical protein